MRGDLRGQPSSRSGLVRHAFRGCLAATTLIVLAACGGGGGGGGGPATPPANPPTNPPANEAPVVDAGDDQTIQLPTDSVALSGSAQDADGDELSYAWSAEPSDDVTFEDAEAAETTATFAAAGTYVLTLTVSDGSLSGTDTVQITVTEADPGEEQLSVVAGEDQTIELPTDTVSLAATVTHDDPSSLTYAWTAEPEAGVTFADAGASETTATFAASGTYVLTLTATDGSLSGSDELQVVVDPAMYPAADTDADDAHGWTLVAPADVGLNEELLAQARDFALTGGGSGVIVRYGRLAYSWGDIDARADVKSTTKSIGGIALGLALDDGLLELDDLAQTHLPTVGTPPVENETTGWLDEITILQLATHTAGFEKPGGYGALVAQPGTAWLYSDGGLNWLADLLTEVYTQDLSQLLTDRVWSVLGVTTDDVRWRDNEFRPDPHPDGIPRRELASGISVNAHTMARVGLLFLRDGVWAGQPLISESFVETARTPNPEIAELEIVEPEDFPGATTNYGVLWWTNATGQLPEVPTDAYWAWGLGDSLIVVIPSLDLVIARTGNDPDLPDVPEWRPEWNGDYTILEPFLNPIVQSVEE